MTIFNLNQPSKAFFVFFLLEWYIVWSEDVRQSIYLVTRDHA